MLSISINSNERAREQKIYRVPNPRSREWVGRPRAAPGVKENNWASRNKHVRPGSCRTFSRKYHEYFWLLQLYLHNDSNNNNNN